MKIIFLGTPDFGSVSLEKLVEAGYEPSLIITNPDRPAGRGQKLKESNVSATAKRLNLDTIKPEKLSDAIEKIKEVNPDLMIVAAYGQYIPNSIIEIPKFGILNVHPSLLPKYRGSSPIQYAIFNGDKKTGATIMLVNDEMDKGDILAQKEITISEREIYQNLLEKLSLFGANLLIETIPEWVSGKINPIKQDECKAVYSKILTRYDGKIDWKDDADRIDRQVRAFNPWPGTHTYFNYKEDKEERLLKVLKGKVLEQTECGPFGPPGKTYVATNGNIAVQTGKDFFIIEEFQLEGKNPTKVSDHLDKKLDLIGIILK